MCPTLWDPCQAPLSMRILLARILEWVAMPSSTGSSQSEKPQILYHLSHLSHQGSPRILEWAAYPFSRVSSQPRNWTGVFCIAGRFFTSWATREALGWPVSFNSDQFVSVPLWTHEFEHMDFRPYPYCSNYSSSTRGSVFELVPGSFWHAVNNFWHFPCYLVGW